MSSLFLELIAREQHPPLDWKAVAEETTVGTVYTKLYTYISCFALPLRCCYQLHNLVGRKIHKSSEAFR